MENFIFKQFGVDQETFLEALLSSPSAQGYIIGAISEVLLRKYLENKGFEVIRIKEKPSGGNNAKSAAARGDFYIRPKNSTKDEWLVIESKGLKSNSEFRGGKLDSKEKLFLFLKHRAFHGKGYKTLIFQKGYQSYSRAKLEWETKNKGKKFPPFSWSRNCPGAESCNLSGIWRNENELKKWIDALPSSVFTENSYRELNGPIAIIETHQPSKRIGEITNINQAAPLVADFNIMAVDLYLRTKKHEFVFMNSECISHSPTSPEHLYQNYTIDILVSGLKDNIVVIHPWYGDVNDCIVKTHPKHRKIDLTQVDNRQKITLQ